ncbi:MAG: PAS domain-containing protein [Proteobacteria bacterium]|nr:PAS domain-containing protein [Pseudomonadota bacterium]
MSLSGGASLLMFVDAPVLVGDPEGRAIYVNPCFEARFGVDGNEVQGEHLAALFSGGAREAMLDGVARVSQGGQALRFRIREGGGGFLALVSPIRSEEDFLGVVILLTDEPLADERVLAFHREMQEPLEEMRHCLEELMEQTGGRRAEHYRALVERSQYALERTARWSQELHGLLSGRGSSISANATLDPVRVVRQVASRLREELAAAGAELDVLVPAQLTPVRGDGPRLETALVHLLRDRLAAAQPGDVFTLASRQIGDEFVLFSLVDPPRERGSTDDSEEPRIVRESIQEMGGRLHTTASAVGGRVTAIQLGAVADTP